MVVCGCLIKMGRVKWGSAGALFGPGWPEWRWLPPGTGFWLQQNTVNTKDNNLFIYFYNCRSNIVRDNTSLGHFRVHWESLGEHGIWAPRSRATNSVSESHRSQAVIGCRTRLLECQAAGAISAGHRQSINRSINQSGAPSHVTLCNLF